MAKLQPLNDESRSEFKALFSIPEHWSVECAHYAFNEVRDGTHDSPKQFEGEGYPLVTSKNLKASGLDFKNTKNISAEDHFEISKRSKVESGDILFSMIGTIGNVSIIEDKADFSIKNVGLFRKSEGLLIAKYSYYWLKSNTYQSWLDYRKRGGTQKFVSLGILRESPVLIAPLAEQKRIVEKLDEVLAQVDTIKARLDGIPDLLKRFRQSVLAAAVSGKLTEEWRTKNSGFERSSDLLKRWLSERKNNFHKEQERLIEDGRIKRARKYKEPVKPNLEKSPELFPETWTTVSVSQFAECLDSMRIPVKKEDRASARGLYPYFGANGLVDKVDEYIFDDELVLVTEDETFYGRTKPIAYRSSGKCWVNNHAHVLRASTKAANDYLCYALMYKNVEPWLSGSTGRAKLTQAALNEIPLGLPPEGELNKIVGLVDQFLSFADIIEAQVKKAQARVDKLTQSILAKAFRGELVPQDPSDEPADKLLERIAEARKEAEALAKAAKKAENAKKRAAKKAAENN